MKAPNHGMRVRVRTGLQSYLGGAGCLGVGYLAYTPEPERGPNPSGKWSGLTLISESFEPIALYTSDRIEPAP